MDERKFEIIQQLMDELKEEMSYGADDLGERLGRPKPAVEMTAVEVGEPEEMLEMEMEGEEMGEEDPLKKRLMKLRGA